MFVNRATRSTGTASVQVRFSQAVNAFDDGATTRTFTLTFSDGLATARSMVTVVIAENQHPVIMSVDGQTPDSEGNVNFTVSPNLTVVMFPVTADDDFGARKLDMGD